MPTVVKLGGSLAESGRLQSVARIVVRATVPVVVVPGGGPFADAVRAAARGWHLPDPLAHRLAVLAMDQMALVIAALDPRFAPVSTLDSMDEAWAAGRCPVWQASAMQHSDDRLPADWTSTSDALAARLAERLSGAQVALVKSCPISRSASLDELVATGVVDPVFPMIVRRANLAWTVFGSGDDGCIRVRLKAV